MDDGVIIFGASGMIGSYLFKTLNEDNIKVIGTYNNNSKEGLVHFNLTSSRLKDLNLKGIKYGIISSAMTKLDKCKENPEDSYDVNVKGVIRIIQELKENGIIPVFLSSASVFDGEIGGYLEEDKKNPISLYGRNKSEVEDFILLNIKEYLIIRPGKVFGIKNGEGVLFTGWLEKYLKDIEIRLADDEELSPTYVEDVANGIKLLLKKGSRGIYNINSTLHISRYEMGIKFFYYLGIKDAKIISCKINDFNFSEKRMKKSYMDSGKFVKETGYTFTPLENCFELIKCNYLT